jgi:ribosomal 50S subunit-recycling heat shock protein
MRLDKFLKVSRLIKRRTLAKEVCDQGRIEINDRPAKASAEVKVNDLITIRFAKKTLTVKALTVKDSAKKADASEMFEIINEEYMATPEQDFWNN